MVFPTTGKFTTNNYHKPKLSLDHHLSQSTNTPKITQISMTLLYFSNKSP